jgi:hypothetical protein
LTGFFPSADFAIATGRSDLRLRVRINRFYRIFLSLSGNHLLTLGDFFTGGPTRSNFNKKI